MERLTIKKNNEYKLKCGEVKNGFPVVQKHANKLGQLEDIEEELGIDLITLFKALKNGIWSKGGYYGSCCVENESYFIEPENIRIGKTWYSETKHIDDYKDYINEENQLCLFEMSYEDEEYVVKVKDYGRTWALTREELENGKTN